MDTRHAYRGREIPWLPVVRFHKEIVARAEEGFFSLNGLDDQSDRWTSLADFEPQGMAGPWPLTDTSLISRAFRLQFEQGKHETLYLGGPCYLAWTRTPQGDFVARWRPLLYREVSLQPDGDELEILPEAGTWNLTPLLYSLLDRLEVATDTPIDSLAATVIEAASAGDPREPLGRRIYRALFAKVQGIESEFNKQPRADTFRVHPTPWVLFAPTGSFSALTRHLMRDYERLEHLLATNPANIGGLRLLEDNPTPVNDQKIDVLPLMPLNESQRNAVETILHGHPLTVVSGPPGTGKSQVVVSLLLNAWARGQTVLFASNNNKAVDVVRERIERFESAFPIAVRAGAKQKQNIQELLRRVLNMAGSASNKDAQIGDIQKIKERRSSLANSRERLLAHLATSLPQRIDEGFKAALRAYGEYRSTLNEIAEKQRELEQQKSSFGLEQISFEQISESFSQTTEWLQSIEQYQNLAHEDNLRANALESRREDLERRRNAEAEAVGLTPADAGDWRWLISGPSANILAEWEQRIRALMEKPLELDLEPVAWREDYSRWASAEDAERWAVDVRNFGSRISTSCAELAPKIAEISAKAHQKSAGLARLQSLDIPESVSVQQAPLNDWLGAYFELSTREPRRADSLPWSRAASLRRTLKRAERVIRVALPLAVVTRVGRLDDDGRGRLAPIIESLRDWNELLRQWESCAATLEEVESRFRELRATAAMLRLERYPAEPDAEQWRPVANQCEQLGILAEQAARVLQHRARRDTAQEQLRAIAREWSTLGSGVPIREAWRKGLGTGIDGAVRNLATAPDTDTLSAARAALYSGALSQLLDAWRSAAELETAAVAVRAEVRAIPSQESRVRAWWNDRPPSCLVLRNHSITNDWPDLQAPRAHVAGISDWMQRWKHFQQKLAPEWQAKAKREIRWAQEQLSNAVEILPSGRGRDRASALANAVTAEVGQDWPITEITECFEEFSPERIRAKIERIEAELEKGSFEDAKLQWLDRLTEDTESVRAVDALERALRQYRGELDEAQYGLFREALRSVPVWITTAQAAQAIPLEPELFDLVVIDEASQCTLTNLLPLMYRGRSLTVIGDDNQLPAIPTIQEGEELALARKYSIEEHLALVGHATNDVYKAATESLPRRRADVVMLTEHFRSHPQIIGFSNRHIYQQRLELKKDPNWGRHLPVGSGVHSRPVSGSARKGKNGRSWVNEAEATEVLNLVTALKQGDNRLLSVGIVTPFAAQKEYLREQLNEMRLASEVLADTANGFQGDERDVMIFSPVVAKGITSSAARWVESPPNLINVALTRAREALFVVADIDFCLQQDGILRKLALYCKEIQLLRDTSPAELELFSWMVVRGWEPKVHPRIGDLEVDFTLEPRGAGRVAIEVDGAEFHEKTVESDKARDAYLGGLGYRVVRVPARAVLETPFEVMHRISGALAESE